MKKERNIAVGDLVLVVDDKRPRSSWPVDKVSKVLVEKTKKGKDQTVRSVIVKTKDEENRHEHSPVPCWYWFMFPVDI